MKSAHTPFLADGKYRVVRDVEVGLAIYASFEKEEHRDATLEILNSHSSLIAERDRLREVEEAAQKAYDYHARGYNHDLHFDANTMLALLDELGEILNRAALTGQVR